MRLRNPIKALLNAVSKPREKLTKTPSDGGLHPIAALLRQASEAEAAFAKLANDRKKRNALRRKRREDSDRKRVRKPKMNEANPKHVVGPVPSYDALGGGTPPYHKTDSTRPGWARKRDRRREDR